jgi:hypothetical protein
LKNFLQFYLSDRERRLLLVLNGLQGLTFSSTVSKLKNDGFSESTLKYLLRKFRNASLIECGDRNNPGKPLKLTLLGKVFLKVLEVNE